jgi:hypothetical protein
VSNSPRMRGHDPRRTARSPRQGRRRPHREERSQDQALARQAAHHQGRLRPHRARHPPRPHRRDAQDAALPAARPPRHLPHRRLHRDDRRPDRKEGHPPRAQPRGDPAERRDLQAAGLQDPRPGQDRGDVQQRVARRPRRGGDDQAGREGDPGAHPRARRLQAPLREPPADRPARAPLPAGAGLRLGGAQVRRGDGRHRPALQPPGRPRPDARIRPRAAGRAHHAAARRARRRGEDVEVARQLHRHQRGAGLDLRQGDVDLRRVDVEVLRALHRPHPGRDRAAPRHGASDGCQARAGQAHHPRLPRSRRGRRRRGRVPPRLQRAPGAGGDRGDDAPGQRRAAVRDQGGGGRRPRRDEQGSAAPGGAGRRAGGRRQGGGRALHDRRDAGEELSAEGRQAPLRSG